MAGSPPRGAVVLTGASTGIGHASALHLDRLGFRVFAGVRRDADGEALRRAARGRLSPLRLDVTDAASIEAAARRVAGEVGEGGLAGLVNNAGIGVGGPLEYLPPDELRRQLEVNVLGPLAVTQAFLPLLRRARGRIVFVSSVSGRLAAPFAGPYAASKFALEALADSWRLELRPFGLRVAVVEPGDLATPIWEKTERYADEAWARLPEEGRRRYGAAIGVLRQRLRASARRARPPELAARAIAHALCARRPRTRYRVGPDAQLGALLARLAPDRLRDALIGRVLGA